jgi:hypothetical protein
MSVNIQPRGVVSGAPAPDESGVVFLVGFFCRMRKFYPSHFGNVFLHGEQNALGALVVDSPRCSLASNALQELDQAMTLYEQGSRPCRPPATMVT